MSKKIKDEELLQELIKMLDELIEYAMYMKMATNFQGGKQTNILLDACILLAKIKGSKN